MWIALRVSTAVAGCIRGLGCRQILRRRPLISLEVLWRSQTPGSRLRGVAPLMDDDDTVLDVLR